MVAEKAVGGDGTNNKPEEENHKKSAEKIHKLNLCAVGGPLTNSAEETEPRSGGWEKSRSDIRILMVDIFVDL